MEYFLFCLIHGWDLFQDRLASAQTADPVIDQQKTNNTFQITKNFKILIEKYLYFLAPLAGPTASLPASLQSTHSVLDTLYTSK